MSLTSVDRLKISDEIKNNILDVINNKFEAIKNLTSSDALSIAMTTLSATQLIIISSTLDATREQGMHTNDIKYLFDDIFNQIHDVTSEYQKMLAKDLFN